MPTISLDLLTTHYYTTQVTREVTRGGHYYTIDYTTTHYTTNKVTTTLCHYYTVFIIAHLVHYFKFTTQVIDIIVFFDWPEVNH